jgi:hypothetical protein
MPHGHKIYFASFIKRAVKSDFESRALAAPAAAPQIKAENFTRAAVRSIKFCVIVKEHSDTDIYTRGG